MFAWSSWFRSFCATECVHERLSCFSYINQFVTRISFITLLFQLEVVVNYWPSPLFINCGFMCFSSFLFISQCCLHVTSIFHHWSYCKNKSWCYFKQMTICASFPRNYRFYFSLSWMKIIVFWLRMKINLLYTWNQHNFLYELKSISKNKQMHPLYSSPVIFAHCFSMLCSALGHRFNMSLICSCRLVVCKWFL